MKMTALQQLHRSMLGKGVDVQQFQVRVGVVEFDCLFSVRETPFIFTLTSRGAGSKFFKLEVLLGYRITPYFNDMYSDLAKVLSKDGLSGNKLIPKIFLEELNASIPIVAKVKNVPTTKKILELRKDVLEDREKPYFDAWVYWTDRGPAGQNIKKTQALLGNDALKHSIDMRASTRWSHVDLGRNWKVLVRK